MSSCVTDTCVNSARCILEDRCLQEVKTADGWAALSPDAKPTNPDALPANPKKAMGADKLPLHLVPYTFIASVSVAIYEGMLKYGLVNWRASEVEAATYISAMKRHIGAYEEGEECDPVTKVPHLASVAACSAILIDAKAHGKLIDNRAMSNVGIAALGRDLTGVMRNLEALHADKSPRHYTIADNGRF